MRRAASSRVATRCSPPASTAPRDDRPAARTPWRVRVSALGLAVDKFAVAQPDSLPLAQTQLLRARQLADDGDQSGALRACRAAAQTLQSIKGGADATLRRALPARLRGRGGASPGRVAAGADRDVRHGAVRAGQRHQPADRAHHRASGGRRQRPARRPKPSGSATSSPTSSKRCTAAAPRLPPPTRATTMPSPRSTMHIRKARQEQNEAGEALQAAAPGFGALVQETVSARTRRRCSARTRRCSSVVMDKTRAGPSCCATTGIVAGKLDGGAKRVNALVARFRKSVEPGADNQPPPFDTAAAQELYAADLRPGVGGARRCRPPRPSRPPAACCRSRSARC